MFLYLLLSYLNVVTPLSNVKTLAIVTCKLPLLIGTELHYLHTGLSLLTNIVFYPPLVSTYRQYILGQHGQAQVCIVVVGHFPSSFCRVVGDSPAFRAYILPSIFTCCNVRLSIQIQWLKLCHFKLCIH